MSKILLIAPVPSHPTRTGAGARVRDMAQSLQALGHDVHFLHIQQSLRSSDGAMREYWGDRYHVFRGLSPGSLLARGQRKVIRLVSKSLGANVGVDRYFDPRCSSFAREMMSPHEFDVVIVSYVFYSRILAAFPETTRKIIDTHDVFANRYALYRERGLPAEFFSTSSDDEGAALDRADATLAIQAGDAEHFRNVSRTPVVVVGHLARPNATESPPAPPRSDCLLFVGGPMAINVHGMNWFLRDVFPRIRAERPDAELWLVGGICDGIRTSQPGIRRLGFVDDTSRLYSECSAVINPQQFGTGLSIKCVEALFHGRPLVTTASGARGLETEAERSFLVADSAEHFATQVVSILESPSRATGLARRATEFATRYHEDNLSALADVVEGGR